MTTPTVGKIRHLKNSGVFEDIAVDSWDQDFKKFNVIYGFNGSGKTTICRLLESISDCGLNANLPDNAEFSFQLSDDSKPSNKAPENAAARYIAVFSEDFVERSLAWKSGAAEPIIYLGEEQAELAKTLEELEQEEVALAPQQAQRAGEWSASQRELETHCRERARSIAEELGIGRRYAAPNLKQDYADDTLSPADKRSDEERAAFKEVIWKTDAPSELLTVEVSFEVSPESLQDDVSSVLNTTVQQICIDALERRKDALPWVKQGIQLHKTEQECLFCGEALSEKRKLDLSEALSGGFDELSRRLEGLVARVSAFAQTCSRITGQGANSSEIVPELRDQHRLRTDEVRAVAARGSLAAQNWLTLLNDKVRDPAAGGEIAENLRSTGWRASLDTAVAQLNELVAMHNRSANDFESEKRAAAAKLKRHFLQDTKSAYEESVIKDGVAKSALASIDEQLSDVRQKISAARAQMKTHTPAAKRLNLLLKSYLGHAKITLASNDEGYQICRNGSPSTKPLSEGEKTAVAFCYFVTSLEAEGRKTSDTIVVIDDPISSLDTRAMSHVVGMIRLRFAKAAQFFVLTHNLDFMREMKKWLTSKHKAGEANFLFIETRVIDEHTRYSKIVRMPALIREYESEYHYLFSLVCTLGCEPINGIPKAALI